MYIFYMSSRVGASRSMVLEFSKEDKVHKKVIAGYEEFSGARITYGDHQGATFGEWHLNFKHGQVIYKV